MGFKERLKLAWNILRGKGGIYKVAFEGTVTLAADQEIHVLECEFRPDEAELREDGEGA